MHGVFVLRTLGAALKLLFSSATTHVDTRRSLETLSAGRKGARFKYEVPRETYDGLRPGGSSRRARSGGSRTHSAGKTESRSNAAMSLRNLAPRAHSSCMLWRAAAGGRRSVNQRHMCAAMGGQGGNSVSTSTDAQLDTAKPPMERCRGVRFTRTAI